MNTALVYYYIKCYKQTQRLGQSFRQTNKKDTQSDRSQAFDPGEEEMQRQTYSNISLISPQTYKI